MKNQPCHLTKTIFLATSLTIGCTGSGMAGCGSLGGGTTATVDSELLGIYAVDSYRGSPVDAKTGDPVPDSCDQLADPPRIGNFVVLYSFRPNDDMDEARLAGVFCANVEICQEIAKDAPDPTVGYSFRLGDDENGWVGHGISRTGVSGDQCQVDVQTHTLSPSGQQISIVTDTVEVVFPPTIDGDQASCRIGDALDQLTPDLPCKARLALDATLEQKL